MSESEPRLAWEDLVTEGHVRAARMRRVQPILIAVSVAAMLLGWYLLSGIEPTRVENNRAEILFESVEAQQRRAAYAFGGMPAPRIGRSQVAASPLASDAPTLQRRILDELNLTSELPSDLPNGLRLVAVEPNVFWRRPWRARALIATRSSDVVLAGTIMNSGSAEFPMAERWIGVFRRRDGQWESVTIGATGFVTSADFPLVGIRDIPLTLSPLLETEE